MTERASVARRMVPDQRRAAILRAAGDLFSQHPYADVSVADIAAAAAVSPPLIVFHFGTKKALYLAILAAAADAIRAGLADLAGPPSLDRLRAGVRFYA
ncbi:MAG TPA: helix-turn-helix domain-containing protein, partial [Streptosporangiaceae bacterium]